MRHIAPFNTVDSGVLLYAHRITYERTYAHHNRRGRHPGQSEATDNPQLAFLPGHFLHPPRSRRQVRPRNILVRTQKVLHHRRLTKPPASLAKRGGSNVLGWHRNNRAVFVNLQARATTAPMHSTLLDPPPARHQSPPPRLAATLTRHQRRIALDRAEGSHWFTCAACGELWPDSLAAGRTGRRWFCEACAHGSPRRGLAS